MHKTLSLWVILALLGATVASSAADDQVAQLRTEVQALQAQLLEQQQQFQQRLVELEARLNRKADANQTAAVSEPIDLAAALRQQTAATAPLPAAPSSGASGFLQSMNPDISVVVDTFFYHDNSKEGMRHVFEDIAGFGHAHPGDHDHDHNELRNGFNLRHLELQFSAAVDPYFNSWATVAIGENSAEIEEAVIETSSLPAGLKLRAGKFFSGFSRINSQHAHEWEFSDMPMVYQLLFGDHGLNEKGLQLSWLAPTSFQLLFGIEALQGENELAFNKVDDDRLSDANGPRLWVGWLKLAPNLAPAHALELGLAGGYGRHQEDHGVPGTNQHLLDGHTTFVNADFVYKYDAGGHAGHGDWLLQGGYLWRRKNIELKTHETPGGIALIGNNRTEVQDGLYAQAVYGFQPRWRTGLRWEHIGLTNDVTRPNRVKTSYGDSHRITSMVEFMPTEFSRLRLQLANGNFNLGTEREKAWQLFLQYTVEFGNHAAHRF